MLIRAHDGGNPTRKSKEGRVRVEVTRNKNTPVFVGEVPYKINVNENKGVGNRIFTVKAQDGDKEVIYIQKQNTQQYYSSDIDCVCVFVCICLFVCLF